LRGERPGADRAAQDRVAGRGHHAGDRARGTFHRRAWRGPLARAVSHGEVAHPSRRLPRAPEIWAGARIPLDEVSDFDLAARSSAKLGGEIERERADTALNL